MPNGHDREYCRLMAAVNGFRAKHRRWPVRVRVLPGAVDAIRDTLTDDGFARVVSAVELVEQDDAPFIAEDDDGRAFNYGVEHPDREPDAYAHDWFGRPEYRDGPQW